MARVYNFSAGPAVLPEEVLREAADEMLDYRGCGMSVMEMSHRSKPFAAIMDAAEQDIRDLMGIPDNYRVLFLQGGASTQFAMIPMNLMKNKVADYIVSGSWSKKRSKRRSSAMPAASPPPRTRTSATCPTCAPPAVRRRRLRLHLPERDHLRHRVPRAAQHQRKTAGGRRVVVLPVRAHGRVEVRPHLRRRSEERGPGRRDYRHHPRRPRV